jgi:hypothetical protein
MTIGARARSGCLIPDCFITQKSIAATSRRCASRIPSRQDYVTGLTSRDASLGYEPPAPEVFVPAFATWPATLPIGYPATLAPKPTLS